MGPRRHAKLLQFRRFMLTVEALGAPSVPHRRKLEPWSPQRAGRFQLFGDSLTAFNERCINTVMESESLLDKTEVQVMWTAPPAGSGCVVFRCYAKFFIQLTLLLVKKQILLFYIFGAYVQL
jgi:spondin-1